jgi:hypothetical protein
MFRALLCPSSGALSNCIRNLRFPYKYRGGCVSSRGRFVSQTNKPTTAGNTSTSAFRRKPEAATAVWNKTLDDGHNRARNMLSSVYATKQSILQLIVASGWAFYLNIWRCTEPQTLKTTLYFEAPAQFHHRRLFTFWKPTRIAVLIL